MPSEILFSRLQGDAITTIFSIGKLKSFPLLCGPSLQVILLAGGFRPPLDVKLTFARLLHRKTVKKTTFFYISVAPTIELKKNISQ